MNKLERHRIDNVVPLITLSGRGYLFVEEYKKALYEAVAKNKIRIQIMTADPLAFPPLSLLPVR